MNLCWKSKHHITIQRCNRDISRCIDFSINGLSPENRLRSQRTPKPYKIKVNNRKLIDLVIRIVLIRAILMLRFSNLMKKSIYHFRMFLYLKNISWESRYVGYKPDHRYMFQFIPIEVSWRETKLFDLVTGTVMKPWPAGNMLPNIKICENGW